MAKPNRWSILALLTFAVIWQLTGIWKATSFLRWTAPVDNGIGLVIGAVRRNHPAERGDITEKR